MPKTKTERRLKTPYIDIEKACDTVLHTKLIHKLHNNGNMALKLLENYPSNRIQYVKVNKSYSDLSPVLNGILPVTLLGPLFFIIYIIDIVSEQTKINFTPTIRKCVFLQDSLNLCDDIANVERAPSFRPTPFRLRHLRPILFVRSY